MTITTTTAPRIEALELIFSDGFILPIYEQLLQMQVFEDIFSPVLTGQLFLNDNINLFNDFPIIGEEKLHIKFKSWNYSNTNRDVDFIHRTFDIIKISNIEQPNDSTKTYVLHFASPELKKNEAIKISKAYVGKPYSEIIKDIMTSLSSEEYGLDFPEQELQQRPRRLITFDNIECNFQKVDDKDSIELFVEKTKYTEPVVTIPYSKPFDIIKNLSSKALRNDNTNSANFLFFENKRGFQFTSLETLFQYNEEQDKIPLLVYGAGAQNTDIVQNIETFNSELELEKFYESNTPNRVITTNNIIRLQIQDCYDVLKNINSGMYSSKLYNYDLLSGETSITNFSYKENFAKEKSLEIDSDKVPMLDLNLLEENSLSEKYNSKVLFQYTAGNNVDSISSLPSYRYNLLADKIGTEQYIQKRLSKLASLNNYRVIIEVSGNSLYKVGDLIELDLRITKDIEGNSTKNRYYSGNYLISSIKHNINNLHYTMQIELIKDSFKESNINNDNK